MLSNRDGLRPAETALGERREPIDLDVSVHVSAPSAPRCLRRPFTMRSIEVYTRRCPLMPSSLRDPAGRPASLETQLEQPTITGVKGGEGGTQPIDRAVRLLFHQMVLGAVRARMTAELVPHVVQVFEQPARRRAHRLGVEIVRQSLEPAVAELLLHQAQRRHESLVAPMLALGFEPRHHVATGLSFDVVEAEQELLGGCQALECLQLRFRPNFRRR